MADLSVDWDSILAGIDLPPHIQRDEQGRPFIVNQQGKKSYLSPASFGAGVPTDDTGMFRSRPQWNQDKGEWETPISWGNIASLGTGAALGAGALSAAGLFGGGAGSIAPSAAAPSSAASTGVVAPAGAAFPGLGAGTGVAGAGAPAGFTGTIAGAHPIGTGMITGGLPAGGVGINSGGGTFISKLLGKGKDIFGKGTPSDWSEAGRVLGNVGEAEALNRYKKGNFIQNYDQLMMQAEQARNRNEADALSKLNVTKYLGAGGREFKPASIRLGGEYRTLPDFGFGHMAASPAQRQAAGTLESELVKRLAPGGSYTPTPVGDYADRGTIEKIGQYGGLIPTGVGIAKKFGIF